MASKFRNHRSKQDKKRDRSTLPAHFTQTGPAVNVDDTSLLDTAHSVRPKIPYCSVPRTSVRVHLYRDHPQGIHRMKFARSDLQILSRPHVPGKFPPFFFFFSIGFSTCFPEGRGILGIYQQHLLLQDALGNISPAGCLQSITFVMTSSYL